MLGGVAKTYIRTAGGLDYYSYSFTMPAYSGTYDVYINDLITDPVTGLTYNQNTYIGSVTVP